MKEKEKDMISLERWGLFMNISNISNISYSKYGSVNPCIKLKSKIMQGYLFSL